MVGGSSHPRARHYKTPVERAEAARDAGFKLNLMHVKKALYEEVAALAGEGYSRKEPTTRGQSVGCSSTSSMSMFSVNSWCSLGSLNETCKVATPVRIPLGTPILPGIGALPPRLTPALNSRNTFLLFKIGIGSRTCAGNFTHPAAMASLWACW